MKVHWLNKRKRSRGNGIYRKELHRGFSFWGVDCPAQGWLFMDVTTDPAQITCKSCRKVYERGN